MDELKPCPFCGKRPKIGSLDGDEQNWAIWCPVCNISFETGINGNTKEELIKKWNTRKGEK